MDFYGNILKNARKEQKVMQKRMIKNRKVMQKRANMEQKAMQKNMERVFRQSISKEGRVRIPAKRKHEVEDKYNKKCAVCKKKPKGVTLQFHHKNMKNNDNRLSNLELLCPNHHYQKHSKGKNKKRKRRQSFI